MNGPDVAFALCAVIAVIALYAASGKFGPLARDLRKTYVGLGFTTTIAARLARATAPFEIALAALGLLSPAPVASAALAFTGVVMVAAGVYVKRHGLTVPCHCFSPTSIHPLGMRQVLAGLALVAISTVVAVSPSNLAGETRMAALSACILLAAVLRLPELIDARRSLSLLRTISDGGSAAP